MRWPFGEGRKRWKGLRATVIENMEKATIDGPESPPAGHRYCDSCDDLFHEGDLYALGQDRGIRVCGRCIPGLLKQLANPVLDSERRAALREIMGKPGEPV